MKKLLLLTLCFGFIYPDIFQDDRTKNFPKTTVFAEQPQNKENVWVFMMAGQSNMAGRGQVEPQDTLINKRILTINADGKLIYAKEPFHFYEPTRTGLDCGLSFAQTLIKTIPGNVTIVMIPTAVGGSSISQWLGDSTYRTVKLLSNFKEKTAIAKQYGQIKAILWHQGESDANKTQIPLYQNRLQNLFTTFRAIIGNDQLPVLGGELGSYSNDKENWSAINRIIHAYAVTDKNMAVIPTADFIHKGDTIHFNSEGQRMMGERFAKIYLTKFR